MMVPGPGDEGGSVDCCGEYLERSDSRRRFLQSLAALGAAAVVPGNNSIAQTTGGGPAAAKANRIDVHHHILSPAYRNQQRERILAISDADPSALFNWTPEKALDEMDKYGIATGMGSIPLPGVWFGNVQEGRSIARQWNEYTAQLAKDHPGRFGLMAALPLPDQDGSLGEIEYAFDVLKADGIGLITSYGDKWPGDPAFAPVFAELNRRKAVVYFHPTAPNCCFSLVPGIPPSWTEFLFDTTRAIDSLLINGAFTRYPEIRFIFSHAGGTIAVLANRIAALFARHKEYADRAPNGVIAELKKLYYDVANSVNPSSMSALTNLVPQSQMLFGSDYPYIPVGATAGALDQFGLAAPALQAINRDNATRLFPRLKSGA
jgi:predicted TIM-barrel fold metal-dependent hydrolase